MKKVKLLLVALATISFTAFFACSGNAPKEEATQEKTEEPAEVKEATDTTVVEEAVAPEEEAAEEVAE
ncbi:MAG: acylneuraminate cytidylyltransferase [Bacteroidetes bacterium]|nr:acylneuraminate cytidylyltransferase [Bacteroidota bacterium]